MYKLVLPITILIVGFASVSQAASCSMTIDPLQSGSCKKMTASIKKTTKQVKKMGLVAKNVISCSKKRNLLSWGFTKVTVYSQKDYKRIHKKFGSRVTNYARCAFD